QTYDFSAAGSYTLQVWVTNPGDPIQPNDTLTTVIRQLLNDPLALNPSYTEGFETAAAASYTGFATGFTGLDRGDFNASDGNGRVRTFINTGFARTGQRAATLDRTHYNTTSTADSMTLTFNLSSYSSTDQLWLDFYYQNQGIDFNLSGNQVWIRGNDQASWIPVYMLNTSSALFGSYQPSAHIDITGILKSALQTLSSSFQVRFGEQGFTSTNSVVPDGDLDDGYSFDDITISRSTNDIGLIALVSPNLSNSCALSSSETIQVKVRSYSSTTATNIPVTYSINGVTVTETIPSINPFDSVIYTFSQTADLSAFRTDTIRAWVSMPGDNYSFNDTLAPIIFHPLPIISSFPYLEGFENNNGNWFTGGINSSWQWGAPAKTIIRQAAGGTKCWVTSLAGNYNDNELSYLYSPCFDLSSLTSPVLSFSHIFQTEDACDCDYHWMEYSTDGVNWVKLGVTGNGTNWYDNATRQAWQKSDTIWHVSSYDIPTRSNRVRFRMVFSSDPATNFEGVGVDDIHIFDKASIYSGPNISSGLAQAVSGTGWIPFDLGGHRILAINPNGQDLGNTQAKVYINTAGVRNDGKQYYLDRNIVIQPTNAPTGNVSVRFYFLESEINAILHATGCTGCTTLHDAYQSGITQYSSPIQSEEDSTLSNDSSGFYHFFLPRQQVSVVPYDNGYYAEYQVAGFSEFWVNNGGLGQNQSLPLTLLSFTATRSGANALLQWTTSHETNTLRYIIEKSADGSVFNPVDSVAATDDSIAVNSYRYTDKRLWQGLNYYRLIILDRDGHFTYSPVRTVTDSSTSLLISIYPNPIQSGDLYISSSANCRHIALVDAVGRTILQKDTQGFFQAIPVVHLAKGVYVLLVDTDSGRIVQKVFVK
ncbi:MAG TPA: T9SS type A sorting domain-containing protein, partial [Puia sp.]|nr:T9SS type A sorting domain-containing protein [Puia sp.]